MPQFQCAGILHVGCDATANSDGGDTAEDSGNSTHPIHGQSCGRGSKSSENGGGDPEPQCTNLTEIVDVRVLERAVQVRPGFASMIEDDFSRT